MQMLNFDMAEHQLAQVRQTGDRLRGAVRALVDAFPPGARSISGMARYLTMHKATCQRIVEGLEHVNDSLESFARFPGLRGLLSVIEAAERKHVDPPRVAAARAAIAEYERLLVSHGRTQSGLVKLIDTLRSEAEASPMPQEAIPEKQSPDLAPVVVLRRSQRDRARNRRKALFDAARIVTGEEVDVKSVVGILRPSPTNPAALSAVFAVVLQGVRRHPFSRPIVPFILGGWWAKYADRPAPNPAGMDPEIPPHELLGRFSTTRLTPVRLQGADGRTLLVADLEPNERGPRDPRDPSALGPADVAVLFRSSAAPNPAIDAEHRLSLGVRITNPCRAVVINALVHRSISCVPPARADAYSLAAPPGDSALGAPEYCWHERFPDSALVERVHSNDAGPDPMYPRQAELVSHLLEREGLDRREFLHLRAQTAYPLWQTEYRLDFGPLPVLAHG